MASSDDEASESVRYREVITRKPPWWIVTLLGPDLPDEGVSARSHTLDRLREAADPLYPPGPSQTSSDIEYDFGPETNASMEALNQARIALREAWQNYHDLGHQVTTALADEQIASLQEIAGILSVPYAEVARLQAYRPPEIGLVEFHDRGLRHFLTAHARPWIARGAGWGARTARVVASDARWTAADRPRR